MSASSDEMLDDSDIQNPWERIQRLGGALEIVGEREDRQKLRQARLLLKSLEQQIDEEGVGDV